MKLRFEIGQKRKVSETPASNFAPLTVKSKERVVLTIKATRQENKKLKSWKQEIEIEKSLHRNSVDVQEDLSDDLMKIFDGVPEDNLTSFMWLFWTEQMKYIRCTNKKQLR